MLSGVIYIKAYSGCFMSQLKLFTSGLIWCLTFKHKTWRWDGLFLENLFVIAYILYHVVDAQALSLLSWIEVQLSCQYLCNIRVCESRMWCATYGIIFKCHAGCSFVSLGKFSDLPQGFIIVPCLVKMVMELNRALPLFFFVYAIRFS